MTIDMANGKRIGSRRATRSRSLPDRASLILCLGITICVVAWGYQVFAAIDFGTSARDGESSAWGFLALACVGAAACLFAGLLLGARLLRRLGITVASSSDTPDTPDTAASDSTAGAAEPGVQPTSPPTYTAPPGPYRGKRIAR